jgi:hypothetical protein
MKTVLLKLIFKVFYSAKALTLRTSNVKDVDYPTNRLEETAVA